MLGKLKCLNVRINKNSATHTDTYTCYNIYLCIHVYIDVCTCVYFMCVYASICSCASVSMRMTFVVHVDFPLVILVLEKRASTVYFFAVVVLLRGLFVYISGILQFWCSKKKNITPLACVALTKCHQSYQLICTEILTEHIK